ncbi:ABC transporter ATP-binding protein [Acinetobacter sp. WZC-1]|uniref:ABC transporter ATP-binding protein n=1 Tax=Acinetobacter sp. WZC-1 TaxID=3459034 RepID=UPI00403DE043
MSENPAPANPQIPLLNAVNVTAGYKNKVILHELNLSIHAGEIYALLGANGAGKTTTLSLFLGFLTPISGQVFVNQIDVTTSRKAALQQIAYIPESVALYEHLTAQENIAYLLELAGQTAAPEEISRSLLSAGLQETAIHQRVSDFSKGMRQKVAIALAFTRKVPVLLLDEPTSGLDPKATGEFNQLLEILRNQGVAILMVTHDLLGAAEIADRIGFIAGGQLAEEVAAHDGAQRFDVSSLHQRYVGWAVS